MMGVTVGDCKIRSCNSCTLWEENSGNGCIKLNAVWTES